MNNRESRPVGDFEPPAAKGKTPEDAALEDLAAGQGTGNPAPANLDELQQALADAESRAARAQAELENFRKRMRRERQDDLMYAALPLMRDMLPVIDNLERAIMSADDGHAAGGLVEGVQMVLAQLQGVLEQHQCQEIPAAGQPFDPMSHEAVAQQPSDEFEAGVVIEVQQPGYRLHDRIIRPALVVVSQGPGKPAR